MSLPPVNPSSVHSSPYPSVPSMWKKVEKAFGHVCKTLSQIPHQIYTLNRRIKNYVQHCFAPSSAQNPKSFKAKVDHLTQPFPLPLLTFADPQKGGKKSKASQAEIDVDLSFLFAEQEAEPKSVAKPQEEITKQASVPQVEKKEEEPSLEVEKTLPEVHKASSLQENHEPLKKGDPFKGMGALTPGVIQPEIQELKSAVAIEEKKDLKEDVLSIVEGIVQPAQALLQEIETREPAILQDYLTFIQQLTEEFEPLKQYASSFAEISPPGHQIVQETIAALEKKMTALEKDMCEQVREHYQPNPEIPGDGNCLFWSIEDQCKTKVGQQHYRKIAADYMQSHSVEFQEGISDVMRNSSQAKSKLAAYARTQKGKKAWAEKLEKKLGRKPTDIDFYCECLANSSLWGGVPEILAVMEKALQAPVMVFTRQKVTTWRVDAFGQAKFANKPPILLYYNGINHYQSLILKKK